MNPPPPPSQRRRPRWLMRPVDYAVVLVVRYSPWWSPQRCRHRLGMNSYYNISSNCTRPMPLRVDIPNPPSISFTHSYGNHQHQHYHPRCVGQYQLCFGLLDHLLQIQLSLLLWAIASQDILFLFLGRNVVAANSYTPSSKQPLTKELTKRYVKASNLMHIISSFLMFTFCLQPFFYIALANSLTYFATSLY